LADRYDELTDKTLKSSAEHKELDDIIKELARNVPNAVTEINEYGQALAINTDKVREFANENRGLFDDQRQAALLRENEEQLRRLQAQQQQYNNVAQEGLGFYVEGVGRVANYNGVLKEQIRTQGRISFNTREGNALTSEQIDLVQKAIRQNEQDIKQKETFIESLTEEGRARIAAREEAERQAAADQKLAQESEALANLKADEALRVSDLKDLIKELRQEQESLTDSDVQRSQDIIRLINIYQKQIDSILGVAKANKSAQRSANERLRLERQLAQDIFNLDRFALQSRIAGFDAIAQSEEESFSVRRAAIEERTNVEIELLRLQTAQRLNSIQRATSDELKIVAEGGERGAKLALEIEEREKNARLLIERQFQAERRKGSG